MLFRSSTPPEECPFPRSKSFSGVEFTGRHAEYTRADTWYPSWASDGDLYSPWTDGSVEWTLPDGREERLRSGSWKGRDATTGHAKIIGDDPMNLKIASAGVFVGDSPDGKAYLVVQGSSDGKNRRYAYNSWINSDQTYLIRVTPSIANMNDASKYEFFAGRGADDKARWTRDFAKMKPLLEWRDRMGRVSATYNPALRKYFMCMTDGRTTISKYNTYLLEADEITGPWRLVTYMRDFGEQAYFVNIPSKFIDGKDGRTMWLCYAANWWKRKDANLKSIPFGSRYGMCLQEFRLVKPDEKRTAAAPAPNPLLSPQNLARKAKVRTSSDFPNYNGTGAVDGVLGGYPNDISTEWAAKNETCTAFIRLDWDKPQTIRAFSSGISTTSLLTA